MKIKNINSVALAITARATAGVAGGADVILILEVPSRCDRAGAKLQEREKFGKNLVRTARASGISLGDES